MKIRHIFVDMDGVLADFEGFYEKMFGKNVNIKHEPFNLPDEELWGNIDKYGKSKFFENLPWINGSKEMWDFVVKNFVRVKILSALGKTDKIDKQTSQGKYAWLSHHLPELRDQDIILVENKHRKRHYSRVGDIIIDDTPVVIQEWRHKGGTGILFESAGKTIEELKKYVYEEI